MPQINVSVPPALKIWVDGQVAGGRYSSPSDCVRELLRRAQEEEEEFAWLQSEIRKGLDSPIIERDAIEVLDEIVAKNRARHADHRSAA